jgi:putative MATE family efflux protein
MVGGMLSMVTFHLADTYFVAQLDESAEKPLYLAAMSFTFPVVMLVGAVSIGLGVATSSVVSRAIGKGDLGRVRRLASNALILAVLVVAVIAAIGLHTMDPLFRLLGAEPDVLPLIKQYMRIWFFGAVFVIVPMVGNNVIRASGDTLTASLVMIVSASINVVLDPLLIFGLWGLPRLELRGAAYATVIARACSLVFSLLVLRYRKKMIDFTLPSLSGLLDAWKQILYIAGPAAATTLLFPISMGVITRLVAAYGESAVAAMGAGNRVESFVMMVVWALASTVTPFVGQNYGADRLDRVHRVMKISMLFSIAWGGVCFLVFLGVAPYIARAFHESPQVQRIMTDYLRIISFGLGLRGLCILSACWFNATNRPLYSAGVDILRMFVLYMPLAAAGSWLFGLYGIFFGVTLGNSLAGPIAMLWVRHVSHRDQHRQAAQRTATPTELTDDAAVP